MFLLLVSWFPFYIICLFSWFLYVLIKTLSFI
jgi:hypothetical protein